MTACLPVWYDFRRESVKDAVPRSPRVPRQASYPGRPFAALFDVCRREGCGAPVAAAFRLPVGRGSGGSQESR